MSDQKVLCDYFNKRLPGIRCGMTEEQHRLFPMTGHDFTPQPAPPLHGSPEPGSTPVTDEALRALVEEFDEAAREAHALACGYPGSAPELRFCTTPRCQKRRREVARLALVLAAAHPAPVLDVERLADILLREFKELYAPSLPGWTGKAKRQDPRPDALADATRLAAAYQTALAARTEGR